MFASSEVVGVVQLCSSIATVQEECSKRSILGCAVLQLGVAAGGAAICNGSSQKRRDNGPVTAPLNPQQWEKTAGVLFFVRDTRAVHHHRRKMSAGESQKKWTQLYTPVSNTGRNRTIPITPSSWNTTLSST
jgi:hypothetical protein